MECFCQVAITIQVPLAERVEVFSAVLSMGTTTQPSVLFKLLPAMVCTCLLFETGSHVAQAVRQFPTEPRMAFNFRSSRLHFSPTSADITGVHHHT